MYFQTYLQGDVVKVHFTSRRGGLKPDPLKSGCCRGNRVEQ